LPPAQRPILLFGSGGQLGRAIRECRLSGDLVSLTRDDVDLEDLPAVRRVFRRHEPSVVINCAAFTAVDRAEGDRSRCFAVNADAPVVIGEEAERAGSLFIHYSSDYVFDGRGSRPYVEADATSPLNVYGESKAAADLAIPRICSRFVILRAGWIFGAYGSNFVKTMLRLARERDELRVVDDQIGSPTSARFVAATTAKVIDLHLRSPSTAPTGLFHSTLRGSTTWYGFARAILESDASARRRPPKRIIPITTHEFGAAARRPAYSVLDSAELQRVLATPIPDWTSELADTMNAISGASPS
jgi:dTDP-4-dehydrorhamnose reductase